jgi:hypothetical protein
LLQGNIIIYLFVSSASPFSTATVEEDSHLAQNHVSAIFKHIKSPSHVIHDVEKPSDVVEEYFGSELIFGMIADVFHPDFILSELSYETEQCLSRWRNGPMSISSVIG